MKQFSLIYFLLLISFVQLSCSNNSKDQKLPDVNLDQQLNSLLEVHGQQQGVSFFQLPSSSDFSNIPQDPKNPITKEKIALGKFLFHETAIGTKPKYVENAETYSCASCHHADAGFQAGMMQGIGEGGDGFGVRGEGRILSEHTQADSADVQSVRSPTVLNVAFTELVLWNGQFGAEGQNSGTEAQWTEGSPKAVNHLGFKGVETQAIAGLAVHRLEIKEWLQDDATYGKLFDDAYANLPKKDRCNAETAGMAIAAYERTITAEQAPFQQYLRGNQQALSHEQKQGAILFFGKANCVSCHTGPALNSDGFHALGMSDMPENGRIGTVPLDSRLGRGGFTKNPKDNFKFRTPQLYNLKDSPFLGHGGSYKSVREVIEYKNLAKADQPEVQQGQLSPAFVGLNLSAEEINQLTDFIENGLYDPNLRRFVPDVLPSNNCFPNNDQQSKMDLGCEGI